MLIMVCKLTSVVYEISIEIVLKGFVKAHERAVEVNEGFVLVIYASAFFVVNCRCIFDACLID
jgi:hypothetical protein